MSFQQSGFQHNAFQTGLYGPLEVISIHVGGTDPTFPRTVLYQSYAIPAYAPAGVAEDITVDKWFASFGNPVRLKPGLLSALQQSTAFDPFPLPEVITVDKWFQNLSEPVRTKKRTPDYPFLAFHTNPVVSFGWIYGLSEPVRRRPQLNAALNQFTAFDPNPLVSFGWSYGFFELPRPKQSIRTGAQQFTALHPNPIVSFGWSYGFDQPTRRRASVASTPATMLDPFPITVAETITVDKWFSPFGTPIRLRLALLPALQQFTALDPFPIVSAVVVDTTDYHDGKPHDDDWDDDTETNREKYVRERRELREIIARRLRGEVPPSLADIELLQELDALQDPSDVVSWNHILQRAMIQKENDELAMVMLMLN